MKKMSLFYLLIILVLVMGSCTKPDINQTGSTQTVNVSITPRDTSAIYGDSINFTVVTSSSNALSTATFTQSINGGAATQIGSTVALTNLTERVKMKYHVPVGTPGKIKFTCTVTDSKGNSDTASAMINVIPDYNSYSTVLLGNYNDISGKGSFFASKNGSVYSKNTASIASNQSLIDMIFFYDTTNNYTLAAPVDAIFGTGSGKISKDSVQTWTFKNNTNFYTTAITDFSGIHSAADIATAINGGASFTPATRANMLAVGQIIAFYTETGKYGLVQVAQASGGDASGDGALTINVLVQK